MKHPIVETTMEKIARIYANKRDIKAVPGNNFATDGEHIYYVPMPDNSDEYILQKTKHGFLHETDHCVYTNFTDLKAGKLKGSFHSVWNALEDTRIERLGSQEWKGQAKLFRDTLKTMVKREINSRLTDSSVSMFKKILDLTYIKVKEIELGDLGLVVPDKVQKLFDEKVGDQIPAILKADNQKEITEIAKTLHKRMKDVTPPPPPQDQNGQKKPQKNSEQSFDSQGQSGNQKEKSNESENNGNEEEKSDNKSEESSLSDKSKDQESDKDEGDEKGSESGSESDNSDEQSSQSRSSDKDGDGEDSDSSGSIKDSSNDSNDNDGKGASSGGVNKDELKDERKELADDVKNDKEEATINDDIEKDVEHDARNHAIYREVNGLKEDIRRYDGDDYMVREYEKEGQKMLGGNTSKFKRLFISMKAPKMTRMQKSGKLDLKRVWNDDTDVIFQKRRPGILENSAVSMIIDNSSSMMREKANIASAMLAYMARELDRLRIPFECMGFTTTRGKKADVDKTGLRTCPILINLIKKFEEPYRKVRKHFQWPKEWTSGTIEFPCIKYAAQRLICRDETKKVMFILSDGQSGCGDIMMNAMIKYIQKLIKAGVIVVGIGIKSEAIKKYVPDSIVINDLNRLAPGIFNKLSKILLKEV